MDPRITTTTFTRTDDSWKKFRQKHITASEIGGLFGINPYTSPRKILENKLNPQYMDSPAMRRGRILEPAVLQACREDYGWKDIELVGGGDLSIVYSRIDAAISATPDAMRNQENVIVELKTANEFSFKKWEQGVPPLYYIAQVHTQMMCTNIHSGLLSCLGAFEPFPLISYAVEYSSEIEELMLSEVNRFWKFVEHNKKFRSKFRSKISPLLTKSIRRLSINGE